MTKTLTPAGAGCVVARFRDTQEPMLMAGEGRHGMHAVPGPFQAQAVALYVGWAGNSGRIFESPW